MELLTDRLRLRPITRTDIDDLHYMWLDPDVRRYLWDDRIIPRSVVEDIVEESEQTFLAQSFGLYAIFNRDAVGLIGFCGLRMFEDGQQVELLYGILPAWWGAGIVNEAATAVLLDAFERAGVPRILALTDTPNQRSVSVMQRLGMSFVERREFNGLDTVFYSLTPEDFAEHQEARRELGL